MSKYLLSAILLSLLGLSQMAADLAGLSTLKALTAATSAAPAPKVFSSALGLETFSSRFAITLRYPDRVREYKITPELYNTFPGPYNRRNVYGAALSYAPVLASNKHTEPMLRDVMRYTFCGSNSVWRQRGISLEGLVYPILVRIIPKTLSTADKVGQDLQLVFNEYCDEK